MKFQNTKEGYGFIAIALHWIVALGFLGAYVAVYYRHWFSEGEFSMTELNSNMVSLYLHMSFGISIAVFVVLRILWKIANKAPEDVPGGSRLEHSAAHGMHWALYLAMIVMPLTGYMGTKLDTNFFFLFDIPKFNDTALYSIIVEQWLATTWEQFESVVDAIHKFSGAYLVWLLIVMHAGAAVFHHVVRKDAVLKRMAPWVK
ncbi:cytochrome b [Enterovibrio norvegicus]|uniref:cytochrome b n=1 Tax=Enterovibrio norvegicus TaxID=188144 RepID=UPI000C82B108|nr:cytochrome b [Enterovibrio norvegicus]PML78433.1 hypothetical protein BCT69_16515 [Enterovibrio norvegicus]PMN72536.1 hypothetical protein BCT27_14130 [Enterovibrio norvegicus]